MKDESLRVYSFRIWTLIAVSAGLLGFLLHLSDTSLYRIRGLTDINFDIALLLTPWGMVNNLLVQPEHWLRPAYGETASRLGLFDDPSIRLDVAAVLILSVALLYLGYRKRSGGPS